jgi:hypothetical protein
MSFAQASASVGGTEHEREVDALSQPRPRVPRLDEPGRDKA